MWPLNIDGACLIHGGEETSARKPRRLAKFHTVIRDNELGWRAAPPLYLAIRNGTTRPNISAIGRSSVVAGVFLLVPAAANSTPCPSEALGVARTIEVGTQGGIQVGLKTYPRSLALKDHEIALTFDDGPSAQTTPRILDALAVECVKATFFVVGRNAEALPFLVKREVVEGHTVAHHTFSHPAKTLRQMNVKAAQEEIVKGFEADDKAAYGTASGAPKVPFFRFPGLADTPELVAWLSARNIAVFGADFWASDWLNMTPEVEVALILAQLDREKRGILLLHDTKTADRRHAARSPARAKAARLQSRGACTRRKPVKGANDA